MICEQNQGLNVYWKVSDTGQTFKTRKEAKDILGHANFNKLCKERKISLIKE